MNLGLIVTKNSSAATSNSEESFCLINHMAVIIAVAVSHYYEKIGLGLYSHKYLA